MSRHARLKGKSTQRATNTHSSVPDKQQPQTGHQGQFRHDVNVFHHSQHKKE